MSRALGEQSSWKKYFFVLSFDKVYKLQTEY